MAAPTRTAPPRSPRGGRWIDDWRPRGPRLLGDDRPAQPRAVREATREPPTYVMSFLYIGTSGSFIGSGFAFGQVLQNQFAADFATPPAAASLTGLGPLLGSLVRPLGGSLADRYGGARITSWTLIAMALGAAVVSTAGQVGRCRRSSSGSCCCSSSAASATGRPAR